jgi:hypothetical protein
MNLSFVRFAYGILGAFVGAGVCQVLSLSIKTMIIVSAVSFFVSFCWWEYIIRFLYNIKNRD